MVTVEKENRVLDLLTRFSRLLKIVRILGYVKRFVKNCRTHPRLDFQAAVQNVAYATTATGGIQTRAGIKRRLGLGAEESDDDGESYGTKTGVGTGVGFGTENNLKNSRENNTDTRFGNGTNLRLQTVSYRDGIRRLGTWREKRNDDRESYCTKTGVGTGVGFAIKSNRKNSMKKLKETREGIGTVEGICAMVGIGKDKGMNS